MSRGGYTVNVSKHIEKYFLIWETYSSIKKISENASQNKKIYLEKKNFIVPTIRKFILI